MTERSFDERERVCDELGRPFPAYPADTPEFTNTLERHTKNQQNIEPEQKQSRVEVA